MPRNPSPEDDEQLMSTLTTSSPSPSLDPTPSSPLFMPSQSPDMSTEDPGSWASPGADEPASEPDPASSSGPRSTGKGAAARLRELRKTAAAAVATAGGIAHQLLTREGSPEREVELWVPDDDDVEAISDPLAGLASRRMPAGAENPDITDLIRLAMGLAGYALKQRAKAMSIVRYFEPEADDQAQPEPGSPAYASVDL